MGALQTKELECLLDTYWLSNDGCLYRIDGSYLSDLDWIDDEEEGLLIKTSDSTPRRQRFRLKPYRKSGVIRFVADYQGEILEAVTYFKVGRLNAVLCKGEIFTCESIPAQDML